MRIMIPVMSTTIAILLALQATTFSSIEAIAAAGWGINALRDVKHFLIR